MATTGLKKALTLFFAVCLVFGLMPSGMYAQMAMADTATDETDQELAVDLFDDEASPDAIEEEEPADLQVPEEAAEPVLENDEGDSVDEADAVEPEASEDADDADAQNDGASADADDDVANVKDDDHAAADARDGVGGIVALSGAIVPLASAGTCGDDLAWTLDDDGVLTISGTGDMDDWNGNASTPGWYSSRSTITEVVIEDGVTSIGNYAFSTARR